MAKARILAVDDQRYFRTLLDEFLGDEGYDVRTTESGEEAMRRLEQEAFDVVVTDLVMPGLSGADLVERVKARWPSQDVVVVTSVGDVRAAVEAMRRGASDYLLKPLDPTLLARSLDAILQGRRLRQEHAALMAENLEYLGVLSLYERAMALFATLAPEPLADRIAEGLSLEVRAQGAVVWLARPDDPGRLRLAAARGLVRVAAEPEELALDALAPELAPLLEPDARPLAVPGDGERGEALLVPFRHDGRLLGFARITDKLSGTRFEPRDRAVAERFAGPAALAVANALRVRALEHRSFRDPVTKAYSFAFFEDVLRAEIRKAGRFGRRLSLLAVDVGGAAELRRSLSDAEFCAWRERVAYQIGRVLRTTDLAAVESEARTAILLPETDALGAAVLKRRLREVLERGDLLGSARAALGLAAASYPMDGARAEELLHVLGRRLAEDREGLVRELALEGRPFPIALDALAAVGRPLAPGAFEGLLRFVLAEVERRAGERGIACIAPGRVGLHVLRDELARLDPAAIRAEVVVLCDEDAEALAGLPVTRVPPQRIGTLRPFAFYYAEGPSYAVVAGSSEGGAPALVFQTGERALVEHLAFQLHRALGVPIAR